MHVLIAGVNGSGKSTLACSLYLALRDAGQDVSRHEIDVWSDTHACILGEKKPEDRNKRGNQVVNHLADEFADAVAAFVADESEIVLGDLHGCLKSPTAEYWQGLRADWVILVDRYPSPDDEDNLYASNLPEWREWMAELGIEEAPFSVFSFWSGQEYPTDLGPTTYVVHDLDRAPTRQPVVQTLARKIQQLTTVPRPVH